MWSERKIENRSFKFTWFVVFQGRCKDILIYVLPNFLLGSQTIILGQELFENRKIIIHIDYKEVYIISLT